MAAPKMTRKHKLAAWVLNQELEYPQAEIANLMKVSQSTVSHAVKEASYMIENKKLSKELAQARHEIEHLQLPRFPERGLLPGYRSEEESEEE